MSQAAILRGLTLDDVEAARRTLDRFAAQERAAKQAALDARTPSQVASDAAGKAARSTRTSADELAKLASHPSEKVRLAVARNKNTPAGTLAILATDASPGLRAAVAKNPNGAATTLDALVGDTHLRVLTAIAENDATPQEVLHRIVSERPDALTACRSIAGYRRAAAETFLLLARHPDEDVRGALASNRYATPEAMRALAFGSSASRMALYFLAQRKDLPGDVVAHIAAHPDAWIRRTLVETHDLTEDQQILVELAGGIELRRGMGRAT